MDAHKQGNFTQDGSTGHKENFDASRGLLQSMTRLEVEMNESLSLVLKEEDLQRMLVSDLKELMRRNQNNLATAVKTWTKAPQLYKTSVSHKSTQIDERDDQGVVSDLIESPRDFNPDHPPIIPVSENKCANLE